MLFLLKLILKILYFGKDSYISLYHLFFWLFIAFFGLAINNYLIYRKTHISYKVLSLFNYIIAFLMLFLISIFVYLNFDNDIYYGESGILWGEKISNSETIGYYRDLDGDYKQIKSRINNSPYMFFVSLDENNKVGMILKIKKTNSCLTEKSKILNSFSKKYKSTIEEDIITKFGIMISVYCKMDLIIIKYLNINVYSNEEHQKTTSNQKKIINNPNIYKPINYNDLITQIITEDDDASGYWIIESTPPHTKIKKEDLNIRFKKNNQNVFYKTNGIGFVTSYIYKSDITSLICEQIEEETKKLFEKYNNIIPFNFLQNNNYRNRGVYIIDYSKHKNDFVIKYNCEDNIYTKEVSRLNVMEE